MKKRNLIALLVSIPIAIQSLIIPMSAEEATAVAENIAATNEYGLPYSNDVLEAYEAYATNKYEQNEHCICLEDFIAEYSISNINDLEEFSEYMVQNLVAEHNTMGGSIEVEEVIVEAEDVTIEQEELEMVETLSSGSGSSGADFNEYYYLNTSNYPTSKPDYSKYNILQLAQKGDIVLETSADDSNTISTHGHTGIVEGIIYSAEYDCYFVRTIEAINKSPDVRYCIFDDQRADDKVMELYKVINASAEQKNDAVEFCRDQFGDSWGWKAEGHEYSTGNKKWLCSQLVWAGYKNQGIDIETNGDYTGDVLFGDCVMPSEITSSSQYTTKIDFKTNLNTVSDGTYYLTNYNSGLRLDIRNGTPHNGAQVQQFSVGQYSEQKWQLTYHPDGRYYTIKSDVTSGGSYYLGVTAPSSGNNAKVTTWDSCVSPEETWFIQKDADNRYIFINGYNGLCMDILGVSTEIRADVQVYKYNNVDDQKWTLSLCGTKLFTEGVYYITNYNSGMRLDIRGGTPANAARIQQYPAGNYAEQKWVLIWDEAWSCYYIKSNITSGGSFYLDVSSPSSGANAKVQLWNACTFPEERWTIVRNSDGTYRFINGYDGLCMDILGGSTAASADVQIYPYIGAADQKWTLTKIS